VNERKRSGDDDWTGWIIPGGALVIAGALLLWTIWPKGSATPSLAPSPTPAASEPDPHIVVTASGTFAIRYEAGDLVVSRLDPAVSDLGRVAVAAELQPVPSGDFTKINASGSALYGLVCTADPSGTDARILFGYTTNPPVTFTGPPATATSAPDGMWLFVLDPGPLDPNATLTITSRPIASNLPGNSSTEVMGSLVDASASGVKQSSGCWLAAT
jgi:hypothetical protein